MVDLQLFAVPRITLKPLVPTFPCFASIYVSLMDKVCDSGGKLSICNDFGDHVGAIFFC